MKKLILDYKTWRSGDEGVDPVGYGTTLLLNDEGFSCCLGQFMTQLCPEIEKSVLRMYGNPSDTDKVIPDLTFKNEKHNLLEDTRLSVRAIHINDDPNLTTSERIDRLKALFFEHGYEIEVINYLKI